MFRTNQIRPNSIEGHARRMPDTKKNFFFKLLKSSNFHQLLQYRQEYKGKKKKILDIISKNLSEKVNFKKNYSKEQRSVITHYDKVYSIPKFIQY